MPGRVSQRAWPVGARLGRGLISSKPKPGCGDKDSGEEVSRELVETGCDAAELLEPAEEALDEIALPIDGRIDGAPDDAAGAAWNVGFGAGASDEFEDGIAVIASVGDHGDRCGQASEQLRDEGHVGSLARRQEESHRQAILVHHGVDFGAQSSTRTANGVIRAPFFPPAAC